MRLVMLGTGPFAVPTFRALMQSEHQVLAVVTRPAPAVRGPVPRNPMKEAAAEFELPVFAPDSINDDAAIQELTNLAPDLLVVCDYGQILKPAALSVAPLGGINLHGSLLPKYRGAAPINWALLSGETTTGVTVIHMTPGLDAGPILGVCETRIDPDETTATLEPRLAQLGVQPVLAAIELLAGWDRSLPIGTPQDPSQASRAPRLRKSSGEVVWTRTAEEIRNQVRALQPWPGTFTFWQRAQGEPLRLILDRVQVVPAPADAHAGTAIQVTSHALHIATGRGALSIDRVQPAGKRVLPVAEFLRGYPVQVGDRFGS